MSRHINRETMADSRRLGAVSKIGSGPRTTNDWWLLAGSRILLYAEPFPNLIDNLLRTCVDIDDQDRLRLLEIGHLTG